MLPRCNTSLTTIGDHLVDQETPLWKGFTFHHFGLLLTAIFAVLATCIALFLMLMHATHYSQPYQQKHIIRILFMIPVYAIISLVSYLFYKHALYWEVLRDCYEAFAIASFFTLLCHYLEPTLHEQKEYFRGMSSGGRLRNWVWPLGWVQSCTGGREKGWFRIPRSGLTWFNVLYVGVFQYCAVRVLFTFVAMISQMFHRYCESSLSPAFAHVWVMVFEASSVTVAMYCLIQFYLQLKVDLKEYSPFMKVLCIKLVIFFSFWQTLLISFLSSSSAPGGAVLKPSDRIAYPDIKVGLPAMLLAVEMTIFAIMHIFAFSWKPYILDKTSTSYATGAPVPAQYHGGFLGVKALLDAFNLWDVVKAAARGFRWLFVGARHRHLDSSYEEHHRNNSMKMGAMGPGGANPKPSVEITGPPFMPTANDRDPRTGRPRAPERQNTDDDVGAALLANSQRVPKISVREPSPYGAYSDPSRESSPYRGAGEAGGGPYTSQGPFADPEPYVGATGRADPYTRGSNTVGEPYRGPFGDPPRAQDPDLQYHGR
ncbi:DUF300-domain-containing protein [Tothia fuscella]|uniref:DUF300-domain-containing protein n=1 Tax=Tothia fuscella TaxID=1048955 RepID=A0A9P4TUP4_9PEZI|nr:DUF300-domain-containing protein [Tothia fuscella]